MVIFFGLYKPHCQFIKKIIIYSTPAKTKPVYMCAQSNHPSNNREEIVNAIYTNYLHI
jgi:hypothetical protein